MNLTTTDTNSQLPVLLNLRNSGVLIVADAIDASSLIERVVSFISIERITLFVVGTHKNFDRRKYAALRIVTGEFTDDLIAERKPVILSVGNLMLKERVIDAAIQNGSLIHVAGHPGISDFSMETMLNVAPGSNGFYRRTRGQTIYHANPLNEEYHWKKITSKFIVAFALMVTGYLVISALPLPTFGEIAVSLRPYFDYQFLLFILAGFVAQMIDGVLSMGYGVTSATCLMSFGVNPVSVSAAIHTSEIFTSGISGYSHYKFGNVNKKLFRHLVVPGVFGAILGALLLVFLGEKGGRWLMPVFALYALFLGIKILVKAFQKPAGDRKVKRIGWLAGTGGFLDSFGGGGWGPIVTSTLIAKGKSPRYTIGSVSLTEFFVTLASAATFFVTIGVQHWNIVLGLLIGGAVAAPIAARLAGRLPRKTMMIAVGIMVIIWCVRMIVKSVF